MVAEVEEARGGRRYHIRKYCNQLPVRNWLHVVGREDTRQVVVGAREEVLNSAHERAGEGGRRDGIGG